MTDCEPAWPDDDEQAWLDLHTPPVSPLAEHGRPCSRPAIPHHRDIHDVLETL